MARSNPLWLDASSGFDSLVIFQGAQAYISPSLYATKQEHGKVVPTYNFMAVHAYGKISVIDDRAWLRAHLARLTDGFESARQEPWKITDAPHDYIDKMLRAVVGIQIPIARLIGKWKTSQNQPQANRISVEQGLRAAGDADSVAMADAVARASS